MKERMAATMDYEWRFNIRSCAKRLIVLIHGGAELLAHTSGASSINHPGWPWLRQGKVNLTNNYNRRLRRSRP
jgi:hypothetical protein